MAGTMPPSPTLSLCDSLDAIDDLDAYLAAQGPLSRFGTPPLKSAPVVEVVDVVIDSDETASLTDDDESGLDNEYIATLLSTEAGTGKYSTFFEIVMIQDMLQRAQLPLEIIGLSLNILRRYRTNSALLGNDALDVPSDLLTVASFALARTYTSDHPPRTSYWSRRICFHQWSTEKIDATMLHMLGILDWRLHDLSEPQALATAVSRLQPWSSINPSVSLSHHSVEMKQPLRITIGETTACWVHGQLTPDFSPPGSATAGGEVLQNAFIPLL